MSPQRNLPVALSSPSITQDDGGTSQEEVEDESVCLCVDVSNFHWLTGRYFEGQMIPAGQPKLITGGIMRSYQLEGMEWLKV